MLWYLLYPIRGTTQPPRLSANHPVRRAFYRHGKTTAEHWLIAMLVSVAIAMAFSYPTVLLAGNPTSGVASYPHQVWTTARPHNDDHEHVDIEMRQVWIHGTHMKALDRDVLVGALNIQQSIVEGRSDALPSASPDSTECGYHSPLLYWNNSRRAIESDNNILETINDHFGKTSSSLNITLRPASVFAGKRFDRRELVAADALVLTLINKASSKVGTIWEDRIAAMSDACQNCLSFPEDGRISSNRVYELRFTPLSSNEHIALTFGYTLMAVYVILSLRRIKAFHSRFGLVVTAITQMTCAILASFTICGMLNINLSMIPQNAYPFVVLVIGLENMFRILNAVLAYSAAMPTELRIANALGDVGPISVGAAVQNLVILSVLSRVVSPGVAAFCAFACIATLFDAFFLLTFFVAVLMVDIRRFELQDALSRSNQSGHKRKQSPTHNHTWFDALVQGRLPFSTRMAGTVTTTTFILSLNYHFFEHNEHATNLGNLFRMIKSGPPTLADFDSYAPLPINATMTPAQWMRMQDYDTTREIMGLARPGADNFVIRIFTPLMIVLSGADRTSLDDQQWTKALRNLAHHHFYPTATAVVFAVAFVAVLMNFLLYTEHEDEPMSDVTCEDALTVSTLALPHRLDIVRLFGTGNGHFVSIGLDRTIVISIYDKAGNRHVTRCVSQGALSAIHWPIHRVTLDETGGWMALHCGDEQISIYSAESGSFTTFLPYPDDNPSLVFDFVRSTSTEVAQQYFICLTSGGRLAVSRAAGGDASFHRLTNQPIVGAQVICLSDKENRLVIVTDQADIISYTCAEGGWTRLNGQPLSLPTIYGRITGAVQMLQTPDLGHDLLLLLASRQLLVLNSRTLEVMSRLDLAEDHPSVDSVVFGETKSCASCGSLSPQRITLLGQTGNTTEYRITSLRPTAGNGAVICIRKLKSICRSFESIERSSSTGMNLGAWCNLSSQAVLGFRKHVPAAAARPQLQETKSNGRLKRRKHNNGTHSESASETWEAYILSADGRIATTNVPLDQEHSKYGDALYVTEAGPVGPMDSQSVVVGFGNVVKIVKSVRTRSTSRRLTGRSFRRSSAGNNVESAIRAVKNR